MPRELVKRLSGTSEGIGGWGGKRGLDPGVRDLVLALNYHGYRTESSCEGGPGHGYTKAFVAFGKSLRDLDSQDIEEIRDIVRAHTDVPFRLAKSTGKIYVILFSAPLKYPYIPGHRPLEEGPGEISEVLIEECNEANNEKLKGD